MGRLTIIGAGPGGYETAVEAARRGLEVTIISEGPVGGTCLNEGCIPTKAYCRVAEAIDDLSHGDEFGLKELSYTFDFPAARLRKDRVVETLRSGVEFLLGGKGITLLRGKASFVDPLTVKVVSPEGEETDVSADDVIIATGSYSASLPIEGKDLPGVITSRDLLDIEEVPGRLCIIGGGVIGLEFASIFNSFGSKVTVLEYCKELLPNFDSDIAKRLKQSLSKSGISIETLACVKGIRKTPEGLSVSYEKKGATAEVECDRALMAVGRRPATGSVNLSDIGVEFTPKGVVVDSLMRTNVPHVYAVGDITGGLMLAHTATFQGKIALSSILGEDCGIDLGVAPAAVFTSPQVASVGMTEEQLKEQGVPYKAAKSFYRANGKAVSASREEGYCKILYSVEDGRILGGHIMGAEASDLISEIAVLMCKKATIRELSQMVHAHPTLAEVILSAANSV